ncbi:MAG: hypothetical protein ACI91B_002579 [Planctomycetota bacterium]|jgi:hypothetical protein
MNKIASRSSAIALVAVAAACARHSGDIAFPGTTTGAIPVFETRVEIDTGSDAHSDYRVADFDNDGDLDMAVISLTGELRVLRGDNGVFALGQELQIDGLPIWMGGGDFNKDGFEDLVVVRSDADETNIYLNNGSGGFDSTTVLGTIAGGAGALAVAVGDLDNDQNLDVVISRPSAPEIVVGYGDGAGGFSSQDQLSLPGGGIAFNVSIGDADRDGLNDLVVVDTGFSRLVIYPGTTTVDFGSVLCELDMQGRTPGAVTFGDLNGDNLDDLVVTAFTAATPSAQNSYIVVTEIFPPAPTIEDGGSGLQQCTFDSFEIEVPAQPSLAMVGDVTGDGVNDLVACLAFSASICIAPGNNSSSPVVADQFLLDSTGMPLRPFLGDFDGNGKQDVCALSGLGSRVNLWLSSADSGRLNGARSYASGLSASSWVEGADFDGDGDFEVVTSSNSETSLSILGGGGALEIEGSISIGVGVYQLEAGDLDLDGKPDLVIGVAGGIKILRNTSTPGNYSFEILPVTPTTIGSGAYPFGIEIGDFDRDADMDIAICDYFGGGVHLIPGTATAFAYDPEIIINVGGGPVDIVAADFTGDGLQDFAVSRSDQADISILRNDGNNQYVESLAVPVGLSPNYLVTADFNTDGRADLVVSNATSGTVSVLFGTANGFSGSDYAAGLSPTALMAQDLTGDGVVDILVASLVSGDFRVLVGDGTGSFPLLPSFPGTLGASDAVLQDMNGDGKPDLIVSSLITDRISFVRNITPGPASQ